ncbi:Aldehyde/histidinol dehydrogenase [Phascolomyces articulosus]|uniref:Aldehyde dehydrogenase n=1 Tax=Phascolomyces articulosus TaxID=60185 RepID=A0AAD5PHB3_9FUNG|nr:Aldehyde/histidinol dehydrogenase [Phascolomyces articulosus]
MVQFTPVDQIPGIVQALHETFNEGVTKDLDFRKHQLQKLIKFFEENEKEIEEALYKDLHKPSIETVTAEVAPVIDECKYMIKNLERLAKPTHTKKRFALNASDKTYIRKEPKGVALIIATNELIAKALPKYLDPRAYSVVSAGVVETTALLEEKFDHIFYTGNGAVGRIVMAAAAKHLTPVTLELGGKSPAIVCDSADIDLTAHRLLWGKFYNNGQTCVAPDYVLVSHDKQEALVKAFRKTVKQFFGENPQESQSYGRIVNHRQFDRLQRILDSVDGNKIVIGGQTDKENLFITPTIVSPVEADDPHLMQDEIFGPILPIVGVKDLTEAVKVINGKDKPLAMYIFAGKSEDYNFIMDKTNSGGTLVNDTLMHLQEMSLPFGGVGPSGMGSYHGDRSFDTFTHERSTMIKSTSLEAANQARYPPYTDAKKQLMSVFVLGLPSAAGAKIKTISTVFGAAWDIFFSSSKTNQDSKL